MATLNITTLIEVNMGNGNPSIKLGSINTPATITLAENMYSSNIVQNVTSATVVTLYVDSSNVSTTQDVTDGRPSAIAIRPTQDMYIGWGSTGTNENNAARITANNWFILTHGTTTDDALSEQLRIDPAVTIKSIRAIYARAVSATGDVEIHLFY